ncbi:MAG: SCP2 sterol-binding domain-containing protein [Microthrixaceae bacterium]
MAKYQFLTPEWVEAAKQIRDEHTADGTPPPHLIKMNQIVTGVPFGEGTVNAHMDTTDGTVKMDLGHIDGPDLTVTLDYETAKSIIVLQDPQAGMQAFMAGKITVDGDMMKLMAMQTSVADPKAVEVAKAIQEITE